MYRLICIIDNSVNFQLSENSKARVVPSSRIGRMISFGSLAAGLGVGTVAQYARNTIQSVTGRVDESANVFMSPANAERIVDTLCKVRGETVFSVRRALDYTLRGCEYMALYKKRSRLYHGTLNTHDARDPIVIY